MTSATDTFTNAVTDLTRRSQEITTTAVRTWADAVQQAYAGFPAPALPDVTTAVDRWFDVAQQAQPSGAFSSNSSNVSLSWPGLKGAEVSSSKL